MTIGDLDLLPAPGRYPFHLTDRLAVVVMNPIDDVVLVGVFFDGQFVRMTENPRAAPHVPAHGRAAAKIQVEQLGSSSVASDHLFSRSTDTS